MTSLKDKVAIITGASSVIGIGAGIARHFATLGAKLLLTGRNTQNLEKVASECEQRGLAKVNIHLVTADLTTDDGIKSVIKAAVEYFGRIDILINNAAILHVSPLEEQDPNEFTEDLHLNLSVPRRLIQLAIPELRKSKGNIVNISTDLSTKAFPSYSSYCISKAGLDHLTRCAAVELGKDGIRVNAVNPGLVSPGLYVSARMGDSDECKGRLETTPGMTPLGRMGNVEDVAKPVAFLASDDAAFITGTILVIDGGILL